MMRPRYILLLVGVLISLSAIAQPRLRCPEIYVGAHAGVMASTTMFNPMVAGIDIMQSPLGVNGGLVFRYAGHQACAIQVEANYMQRGWKEQVATANGNIDYQRQLDYIEIPLLMHLYFGKQRFRAFINLGPQIGYCFSDKAICSGNNGVAPEQILGQLASAHQYQPIDNPFDWGLAGGLGCYYRTKRIGLFQLEARFNYSLGTIYSNKQVDYFSSSNAINLSINFAYLWEIKIK